MSEKLRRCRKELTAAIDRAFEDLTAPFCLSEDCINKQNSDLQTETPSSLPQMNRVSYRRDPTSTLSSYLNQSAAVSCVLEKKNPVFIPNLIPVSIAQNPLCPKREPLTSKENTWLRSSIFVSDRQLPRTLGDRERWRKGHASKDAERCMKSEANIAVHVVSQDIPQALPDKPGNPNSWGIEELAGQLALVNELSRVHRHSGEPPLRDDVLAIFMDASSSSETRHRRPNTEDEEIIQTVLDLEEDYSTAISALHQLN